MKRNLFIIAAIMASVFLFSVGAEAKKKLTNTIDMAAYTCKDLFSEKEDDIGVVLIWFDGYLSGKTGDTSLSMDFIKDLAESVGTACKEKQSAKVMDIVKQLTE